MGESTVRWPERLPVPTSKRDHTQREHVERYKWARERVHGVVLDAACGTGYGSAILSQRAHVIGLDRDSDAVRIANAVAPAARIVQAELPALEFADGSFDFVVSFETVEHVEDDVQLVSEMRRVLKPGGALLMSTPNGAMSWVQDPNPWHHREYELEELRALLERGGFTAVHVFQQRVPNSRTDPASRQIRRVVARFPVLCRPGRWWDTMAHGSPFIEPWDETSVPFFWVIQATP
jgi:2-polyprenyl-3-methyl-5-hydroxy-6-metoxy-1,4-benzoquinol methylase